MTRHRPPSGSLTKRLLSGPWGQKPVATGLGFGLMVSIFDFGVERLGGIVTTLDVLSGGRAKCGLEIGWFEDACGHRFPTPDAVCCLRPRTCALYGWGIWRALNPSSGGPLRGRMQSIRRARRCSCQGRSAATAALRGWQKSCRRRGHPVVIRTGLRCSHGSSHGAVKPTNV